jgi:hypothetical protein
MAWPKAKAMPKKKDTRIDTRLPMQPWERPIPGWEPNPILPNDPEPAWVDRFMMGDPS